jgi:hypothetical protein
MTCRTKSTPIFTLGGDVLAFTKYFEVQSYSAQLTQAMDRTAGNVLHVEKLGAPIERIPLNLKQLSYDEFLLLRNWYLNIADGAMNSFTLTDNYGVDHTVRWVDGSLNFPPDQWDMWSGGILLEVVA